MHCMMVLYIESAYIDLDTISCMCMQSTQPKLAGIERNPAALCAVGTDGSAADRVV
jgi:hypothetical protein